MRWAERGHRTGQGRACSAIVVLAIGTYFVFAKQLPFTNHYTVDAVLHNSNLLVPGSPVRIGGVDVGKVTAVGRYRNTELAQITMQIDSGPKPHRDDATLRIRPRLFLEGNFYVDLHDGHAERSVARRRRHDPARPHVRSGADRPAVRCASRRTTAARCSRR